MNEKVLVAVTKKYAYLYELFTKLQPFTSHTYDLVSPPSHLRRSKPHTYRKRDG
jgi:hypothetical protein